MVGWSIASMYDLIGIFTYFNVAYLSPYLLAVDLCAVLCITYR